MRKLIFVLIPCFAILHANAQLKVHSNGNVSVNSTDSTVLSPLTIGHGGNALYSIYYNGSRNGIKIMSAASSTSETYAGNFNATGAGNHYTYGIKGEASSMYTGLGTYKPKAVGVSGSAVTADTIGVVGFGVHGSINGKCGAAVCGQSDIREITSLPKKYAGLFVGLTRVEGSLEVSGIIKNTLLTMPAPDSRQASVAGSNEEESICEKLSKLDAIEFHHEQSLLPPIDIEYYHDDDVQKQIRKNKHYGIAIEQLEELFPDLVYKDNEGTKYINYMEMIPLLVQSINNLQGQINTLTGKESPKNAPSATRLVAASPSSQAVLFQNSPNPFTERTEIRFSLPDNTANANICIFDLSGKMLKQIPVHSGMQSVTINGYELAAGMYLYSLVINGQEVETKRMILSK